MDPWFQGCNRWFQGSNEKSVPGPRRTARIFPLGREDEKFGHATCRGPSRVCLTKTLDWPGQQTKVR